MGVYGNVDERTVFTRTRRIDFPRTTSPSIFSRSCSNLGAPTEQGQAGGEAGGGDEARGEPASRGGHIINLGMNPASTSRQVAAHHQTGSGSMSMTKTSSMLTKTSTSSKGISISTGDRSVAT
ncbi:unnamed protein product, partial [Amoebophrya sp. A25]|eukprot:GSA25T00009074001.1